MIYYIDNVFLTTKQLPEHLIVNIKKDIKVDNNFNWRKKFSLDNRQPSKLAPIETLIKRWSVKFAAYKTWRAGLLLVCH